LKLDLNDEMTFETEGRGSARLRINGESALQAPGDVLDGARSKPVSLRGGLNRFELEYESPVAGDAEFRLSWSSKRQPAEPVPPTAFVQDAENPALRGGRLAREGRALFAEHQCAKCHKPDAPWPTNAMPELAADAPSFNGIGSRLREAWIVQWLLQPKSIRPDTLMPQLLSGESAPADARDIAAFLASLREPMKKAHTPTDKSASGGDQQAAFPLTPALSPGERENLSRRREESGSTETAPTPNTSSPLLGGEGQGEGERELLFWASCSCPEIPPLRGAAIVRLRGVSPFPFSSDP
jgi:mono/diheme cytochrome c family protein